MSLHAIAHHMASRGRGDDSMLVHMTPNEVAGLQALAMKHGGSLTINPETGLAEAGFLKKLLPAIIGFGLNMFAPGVGTAIGSALGTSAAVGTGIAVGGFEALRTGSLSRGLSAGLGAYGGAGLAGSMAGAGASQLIGSGAPIGVENVAGSAVPPIEQINPSNFNLSNADKLSAGFNAVKENPMAFAKDNWRLGLAAASPVIADAMVPTATKMPTMNNQGIGAYIRPYDFDPRTQSLTRLDPIKVKSGGLIALAEGGNPADDPNARFNTLTGQSRAAYDYLMGNADRSSLSPSAGVGAGQTGPVFTSLQNPATTTPANVVGTETTPTRPVDVPTTPTLPYNPTEFQLPQNPVQMDPYEPVIVEPPLPSPDEDFPSTYPEIDRVTEDDAAAREIEQVTEEEDNVRAIENDISEAENQRLLDEARDAANMEESARATDIDNQTIAVPEPEPEPVEEPYEPVESEPVEEPYEPVEPVPVEEPYVEEPYVEEPPPPEPEPEPYVEPEPAPYVPEPEPYVPEPEPYVPEPEPEPEPYVPEPEPAPYVPEPEPYVEPEPAPYVPEPAPYVPEPEPYVEPEPAPYVPEPEPYVEPEPAPYVPEPEPYVPEPEPEPEPEPAPYVPEPEPAPYVPEPEPYVPEPEPYVPVEQPYVPEPEPYVPEPDRYDDYPIYEDPYAEESYDNYISGGGGGGGGRMLEADDGGFGDFYSDFDEYGYMSGNANGGLMAAHRYARGGMSHLGGYSDGGRLLRGPGDGVSDSIPASIGKHRQPARLADGEFVVPARIVSELGNGSTEAGARKLYAMMDRIQKARGKTVGKGKVAANSRAEKHLPA